MIIAFNIVDTSEYLSISMFDLVLHIDDFEPKSYSNRDL